jgi:uncharacterized membrane protein
MAGNNSTPPLRSITGAAIIIIIVWTAGAIVGTFGQLLPRTVEGPVTWFDNVVLRALIAPELWLTISVGTGALVTFFALANRTSTLREPLAGAITVAFLGFLLFPFYFAAGTHPQFIDTLIWGWSVVMVGYFGSEAAVQATTIVQRSKLVCAGKDPETAEASVGATGGAAPPQA